MHPAGPLAQLFERQLIAVLDPAKFKVLVCGARAGKTSTAIFDFVHGMAAEPGSANVYIGQTGPSARNIFWEPFVRLNRVHGWGFRLNHTEMRARHPNGSWLLCVGSETKRDLEKIRGVPWRRIRIDECGSIRPTYLKYLVEEVLEARLMDYDGDLWLMGTPTSQAFGYFYDACHGVVPGYSVHHWTAEVNPHVDFQRFVHEPVKGVLARHKWTIEHPAFRREYLGEWCTETDRLVFRFQRSRNVLERLPPLLARHDRYLSVIAFDFGYGDAFAWSVTKYPELYGRWRCVVASGRKYGLAPSECVPIMKELIDEHDPDSVVGDVNGIGKPYAVQFNRAWPDTMIKAAQKLEKRGALEMVSDALYVATTTDPRVGLFSLAGNEELHGEWASLIWDEKREDIQDGQVDDIAMTTVYGYREIPPYQDGDDAPARPKTRAEVMAEQDEEEDENGDTGGDYIEASDL